MIRFAVGFLMIFGAVGGLDNDQSILACLALAFLGLILMIWALPNVRD